MTPEDVYWAYGRHLTTVAEQSGELFEYLRARATRPRLRGLLRDSCLAIYEFQRDFAPERAPADATALRTFAPPHVLDTLALEARLTLAGVERSRDVVICTYAYQATHHALGVLKIYQSLCYGLELDREEREAQRVIATVTSSLTHIERALDSLVGGGAF